MKVIDLLNKIANREEVPKKIKIGVSTLTYNKIENNYQYDEGSDEYYGDYLIHWFELNDTVEIIEDTPKEDKKIEKLDLSDWVEITSSEDCKPENLAKLFNKNACNFSNKINEIIDYLKSKEK